MQTLFLNGSLKNAKRSSNTEDVARPLLSYMRSRGMTTAMIRLADWKMATGTMANGGKGDKYPEIEEMMIRANVLIFGTPVVNGSHTSVLQHLFERMGGRRKRLPWKNKPVGVVVPGKNEGVALRLGLTLITLGFWVPPEFWVHNFNVAQLGEDLLDRVGGKHV